MTEGVEHIAGRKHVVGGIRVPRHEGEGHRQFSCRSRLHLRREDVVEERSVGTRGDGAGEDIKRHPAAALRGGVAHARSVGGLC
jgi:hypothetical protein